MNYKETGFRAFYKHFTSFMLTEQMKSLVEGFPCIEEANCVLTYGYIDHDAGLTLEVLALGIQDNSSSCFFDGNDEISVKFRIGSVEEEPFFWFEDKDGRLRERFGEKINLLKNYEVDDAIEQTRNMGFLDGCRDPYYIDDVLVYLTKRGLNPEGCWTRITSHDKNCFIGTLLNEPNQNFGYHMGETIAFFLKEAEDKSVICYTDMTPVRKVTAKELEDGSMLKEAARVFNQDRTEAHFFDVLELLRDSYVWIPCDAVLDEKDQSFIKKMVEESSDDPKKLIGTEFQNQEAIRLIPDILKNGDKFYFPIFSSVEEMGEYGNHFSKIQKHALEAVALARNNEKKIAGVVLNAFSDPFCLDAEIFDIFERMKSSLVEE